MAKFIIREVRAYRTKQRPNPITMHGPFENRDDALEQVKTLARKAFYNDNRSSYYVEEVMQ